MVVKGKLIIDFKSDIEKGVKFWEEIDKFLKFENKYFFLSIINLMIIIQSHLFIHLLMVNIYQN